jgi:hypothetical protein
MSNPFADLASQLQKLEKEEKSQASSDTKKNKTASKTRDNDSINSEATSMKTTIIKDSPKAAKKSSLWDSMGDNNKADTKSIASEAPKKETTQPTKKSSLWDTMGDNKADKKSIASEAPKKETTQPTKKSSLWDTMGDNKADKKSIASEAPKKETSKRTKKSSLWDTMGDKKEDTKSIASERSSRKELLKENTKKNSKSNIDSVSQYSFGSIDSDPIDDNYEYKFERLNLNGAKFSVSPNSNLQIKVDADKNSHTDMSHLHINILPNNDNFSTLKIQSYQRAPQSHVQKPPIINYEPPLLDNRFLKYPTPSVFPITIFELQELKRKYPHLKNVVFA